MTPQAPKTSYQRLLQKYKAECAANERLRLQAIVMSKAIWNCGCQLDRRADDIALRVIGLKRSHKKHRG